MNKEERIAYYSNHYRTLEYWQSHNSTTVVNCERVKKAKIIIKNSGVEQTLKQGR